MFESPSQKKKQYLLSITQYENESFQTKQQKKEAKQLPPLCSVEHNYGHTIDLLEVVFFFISTFPGFDHSIRAKNSFDHSNQKNRKKNQIVELQMQKKN